ncbi:MAG: type II secretion system GspH family protein [Verrucomicrobia bacterium]|nr:type II secretion system GspH family protein [Verrucomicrobiota bacterium]
MRLFHHLPRAERQAGRLSHDGGFTMVEIAIALAVIGFALVAIIGVLPSGLEVQKDNREETIINQDAAYFMDALRNGARGADDLTNYVYEIRRYVQDYNASTNPVGGTVTYLYNQITSTRDGVTMSPEFPLTNGFRIIGLLGTPKYIPQAGGFQSNHVVAYVRALSGPASEKIPQRDTNVQALAFSYRFISEVVSVPLPTPDLASPFTNTPYARHLRANLNEVRLLFRWPMFANGQTGNGRQVFRSQVSGRLTSTNDAGQTLYFFEPTTFVNADVP